MTNAPRPSGPGAVALAVNRDLKDVNEIRATQLILKNWLGNERTVGELISCSATLPARSGTSLFAQLILRRIESDSLKGIPTAAYR